MTKVPEDAELFLAHLHTIGQVPEIVSGHVEAMLRQVELIIADGIAAGGFSRDLDPVTAARAFLQASSPFHPALLLQAMPAEEDAQAIFRLLLAGLEAGVAP